MPRRLVILGSTGSIGRSTLDVVTRHVGAFEVVGLVAGRQIERLIDQIERFRPAAVAVADAASAEQLRSRLGARAPEIRIGPQGAAEVTVGTGAEIAVAGIVGIAGLIPTLAAASAGMVVALANKEALVAAGDLMLRAARGSGARLLPVDSEHNALHQCLRAGRHEEVKKLILTASGGPFRGFTRERLGNVGREQALAHPTWKMGPKISIDSATLMNKGLEVIEASRLFELPASAIEVVIHPESVVHSMVEFKDGSVVAQLGNADMRHPIQYALTWPERWESLTPPLDLTAIGTLSFEPPDREAFPCLDLAYQALRAGGDAPARLNAANEVAVAEFLDGRIRFGDIPAVIEQTLSAEPVQPIEELDDLLAADRRARDCARGLIERQTERR